MTIKHVAPSLVFDSGFQSRLVEWRHLLHRSPEFGFDEVFTSNFIADKLESFGVKVVRGIGKTGVLGILQKGGGLNSIGLRADMDALKIQEQNEFAYRSQYDGMMHACGHDGHSAMLLGAAEYLADRVAFSGTVYFIFQPAEEHGKGARAMIKDGLFSDYNIDAVYGLHNLPGLPAGTFAIRPGSIMASESSFHIQLIGKGGHAAMPYMTVDIMLVASQIVVALQSIVSRNLNVLSKPAVVSVTEFLTDGTVNVLPSKISLKGDCRCFSDETLQHLRIQWSESLPGCVHPPVQNTRLILKQSSPQQSIIRSKLLLLYRLPNRCLVAGKVNGNCDRFTISEDFANMLEVRPGCYGLIGNGGEEGSGCALHNPQYDFNDEILVEGVKYWVKLAETVLA